MLSGHAVPLLNCTTRPDDYGDDTIPIGTSIGSDSSRVHPSERRLNMRSYRRVPAPLAEASSVGLLAAGGPSITTRRQFLASIVAFSSASVLDVGRPAGAQTVKKLTRILVGNPAGGFPDTVARVLINQMKTYASTMILENKPGAGQRIALEALKNSVADGSTMMLSPAGPNVLYPHIYKALSYKPLEDFIPVTTVFDTPAALAVGPMVAPQVKTVADFVGWCRA